MLIRLVLRLDWLDPGTVASWVWLITRSIILVHLLHLSILGGLKEVILLRLWNPSICEDILGALRMVSSLRIPGLCNTDLFGLLFLIFSICSSWNGVKDALRIFLARFRTHKRARGVLFVALRVPLAL